MQNHTENAINMNNDEEKRLLEKQKNAEYQKAYSKKYREKNKERLNEKLYCEICNSHFLRQNKAHHMITKTHLRLSELKNQLALERSKNLNI